MGIDVAMITKNSEYILKQCLESIYENIPVNSLIVVDGHSTDRTLDILDSFGEKYGNVRVLTDDGNRATARQKCIKKVETKYFLFVDSDVVLCNDWLNRAMRNVKDGVGAVWGLNLDKESYTGSKFLDNFYLYFAKKCFEKRGGLHDTLILRDAVDGIRIQPNLHYYEDTFISNWIRKGGYEVVVGEDVYCIHLQPPSEWSAAAALKITFEQLKCGLAYLHNWSYIPYYPIIEGQSLIHFLKEKGGMLDGRHQH